MPTAQIHITLKPTLLDTQGATVLKALHQLGHGSVQDVRIGKLIEVRLDDALLPSQQQEELETMCQKLLANPVIEDFQIVLNGANETSSTRSAPFVTEMATANTPLAPVSPPPIGSESTTIADPFTVAFDAYDAMSADEQLDLQGRAWNLHGTRLLQEMQQRRAAWLLVVGGRVLEAGDSLDDYPSDAHVSALGETHDLVPFVFTSPPTS